MAPRGGDKHHAQATNFLRSLFFLIYPQIPIIHHHFRLLFPLRFRFPKKSPATSSAEFLIHG